MRRRTFSLALAAILAVPARPAAAQRIGGRIASFRFRYRGQAYATELRETSQTGTFLGVVRRAGQFAGA